MAACLCRRRVVSQGERRRMHWHVSSLRSPLDMLYPMQAVLVPHRQGEACGSGPTSNFNLLKAHFYANF